MIIVSSLNHAAEAFRLYQPAYVVSILDVDEPTIPIFESLAAKDHIRLIGNSSRNDNNNSIGQSMRCEKILNLAQRWKSEKENSTILIHCNEGAARSMAVAFILMCAVDSDISEKDIAKRLREAAPHADPNLLLISEADAALKREDRMIQAILDLCPSCATGANPIVALPLAA